jgi:hypothetical protein
MGNDLSLQLLKAAKEREKVSSDNNYNQRSAQRLSNIGVKKIKTSMVGCVAEMEEAFGELWGRNKKPEERTEEEKRWYELFQIARKNMLNLGNNQIRAFQNEINEYIITWKRYNYILPIKSNRSN